MYKQKAKKNFYVRTTVPKGFLWDCVGREITGSSSLGYLIDSRPVSAEDKQIYLVECTDADSEIPADKPVHFVKLDLQGGELDALLGMERILTQAYFLQIEYTGQVGLLEFLTQKGFLCFEQDYLLLSHPRGPFSKLREITLSTGIPAYYARHNTGYGSSAYEQFIYYKNKYKMVCTDLLCVHASKIDLFKKAYEYVTGQPYSL